MLSSFQVNFYLFDKYNPILICYSFLERIHLLLRFYVSLPTHFLFVSFGYALPLFLIGGPNHFLIRLLIETMEISEAI